MMRDERVAAVADTLRRYLLAHPDAADSIDGIRLWWLSGDAAAAPENVLAALACLEAEGVVDRRELPGGRVVFGAARPR